MTCVPADTGSCRDYVYCWADGTKELVAIADGIRASTGDWAKLLRNLRRRGMEAPVVMVGDVVFAVAAGAARSTRSTRRPAAGTTRAARLKTARLHGKPYLYPPRCCPTAAKTIPPLTARAETLIMRLT